MDNEVTEIRWPIHSFIPAEHPVVPPTTEQIDELIDRFGTVTADCVHQAFAIAADPGAFLELVEEDRLLDFDQADTGPPEDPAVAFAEVLPLHRAPALEAALSYARARIFVFPIRADSKRPLTRWVHGGPGQEATTDPDVILGWWRRWPDAWIGIATGPSGWVVIDVDYPKGGDPCELEWRHGPLPPTRMASTPSSNGRPAHHVYLDREGTCRSTVALLAPGVDTRAQGGMVVAPPAPGREWLNLGTPIADAPAWLLEALAKRPEQASSGTASGHFSADDLTDALEKLDANDYPDNGTWFNLMTSCHEATAGNIEAREVFVEWSAGFSIFDDVRDRWNSLKIEKRGNVTEELLINHVREADPSWRAPRSCLESVFEGVPIDRAPRPPTRGHVTCAADIVERPIEWHWPLWIPRGKFALLEGNPKVGKTTIAMNVLARLSTGAPFPGEDGGASREPLNVFITATEDTFEDVLRPQLRVASANLDRVYFYEVKTREGLILPWNLERLNDLLRDVRAHGVRFVYVDTIMGAIGGKTKTHQDADTRETLIRLDHGVRGVGAQVLATRHLNKSEKSLAVFAGMGSIAFTAVARSVLVCARDPDHHDDPSRGILARTGGNLGRTPNSLRYRIVEVEKNVTRIEWGEPCEWSADDLVTWTPDQKKKGDARKACTRWLLGWWGDREEAPGAAVQMAAAEEGHDWDRKTWYRARQDCGIVVGGTGSTAIWRRAP